jgi:hypothetical protein
MASVEGSKTKRLKQLTGDEATMAALSIEGGMWLMDIEFIDTFFQDGDKITTAQIDQDPSGRDGNKEHCEYDDNWLRLCDLLLSSGMYKRAQSKNTDTLISRTTAGLDVIPHFLEAFALKKSPGEYRRYSVGLPSNERLLLEELPSESPCNDADSKYGNQDAIFGALDHLREDLVFLYFRNVHPLFPIVDEYEFFLWYNSKPYAKIRQRGLTLVFHAMMFMAFGHLKNDQIGRTAFSTVKEGQKTWFKHAKSLYYAVMQEKDPRYETRLAQAAALLSFWSPYDGTREVNSFWVDESLAHSLAAKLHEPTTGPHRNKVIWWCCIVRNRVVSLALRRPWRLHPCQTVIPLSLDDFGLELFSPMFTQVETKTRMSKAFLALCHLTDIMKEVLLFRRHFFAAPEHLHPDEDPCNWKSGYGMEIVNMLDQKLSIWNQEYDIENSPQRSVDLLPYERFHLDMIRILYE